ncbi:hypothetical protein GBA52_015865 [Prunus armeniaca]|nr:hypothetical protein GBA52_015865 [Prunus armeniaca]
MDFQNQYQQADQMPKYECLLCDLDDTLYPSSSGMSKQCTKNIEGTAIGYNFDNDDYHSSVHGRFPYEVLRPDHVLRTLLLSLPYRKLIFSNGDKVHVAKTLCKLGLKDCFEGVICFETLNPISDNEDSKSIGCRKALGVPVDRLVQGGDSVSV